MIVAYFSQKNSPAFLEKLSADYKLKLIKIKNNFSKNYKLINPDIVWVDEKCLKKLDFNFIKNNHKKDIVVFKNGDADDLSIDLLNNLLQSISKSEFNIITSHPINNQIIFGNMERQNDTTYFFNPENRYIFSTILEKSVLQNCITNLFPDKKVDIKIIENRDKIKIKFL